MRFEIRVAPNSGFCFGVRRAIEIAEKTLASTKRAFSIGPLIHNPQVIDRLRQAGLQPVDSLDKVKSSDTVVIRSHGVHPDVISKLRKKAVKIVDATCPLVKNAQQSAEVLAREGYTVVILGERNHPEVEGLVGHAPEAVVVDADKALPALPRGSKIGLVAQTTQYPADFRRVIEKITRNDFDEVRIFNTICHATVERQKAAVELATNVDIMFVLGGRNSANTNHLAKICRATGVDTYHLETAEELDEKWLEGRRRVGVTAGASTPEWIIKQFVSRLEKVSGG